MSAIQLIECIECGHHAIRTKGNNILPCIKCGGVVQWTTVESVRK